MCFQQKWNPQIQRLKKWFSTAFKEIISTEISPPNNYYSKQHQTPAEGCPISTITTFYANYLKRNHARSLDNLLAVKPIQMAALNSFRSCNGSCHQRR